MGSMMNAAMMRAAVAAVVLGAVGVAAQEEYGSRLGRREEGRTVYYSSGTPLSMEAISPSLRKWYLPQELSSQYYRQWEYTNYASERYLRYLGPQLEGSYFYDLYGRFLTRGWLVYDWRQVQPAVSNGSGIFKTGQYGGLFGNLVLSHDAKGQHHISIAIGDELRATLTPMTFRKTRFNGIMADYSSDRVSATVLMSRINTPVLGGGQVSTPSFVNNFTNLIGGRTELTVSDGVRIGGTFVNAHNGRITSERFQQNPFAGTLTTGQLESRINRIIVRISDDSPEDFEGGPFLFSTDIEIAAKTGEIDTVLVGSEIGFLPTIEGGVVRDGFRVAEGRGEDGRILIEYVFSDENPDVPDLEELIPDAGLVESIHAVRLRMILSNDYKVEMTSDVQTDNDPRGATPQFRTVARAEGNVKDNSNRRTVVFDYGLPTATQVFGATLQADDIAGFRAYAEANVNHRFIQYPNRQREKHSTTSGIRGKRAAVGWMATLSRSFDPFDFFAEAFGMDAEYDTSPRFVDTFGKVNYADTDEARVRHIYDFVDDNDDNDRKNDLQRRFDDGRVGAERPPGAQPILGAIDEAVFPGLDENNDFIPDFNQNHLPVRPNYIPDYEEPFLRYSVDRPEYLFALDLNNNGWGDRFENDDEPDYPYKRGRRGFNTYLGAAITPEARFTAGVERVRRLSTGERNRTAYGLLAYEQNFPLLGTLTLYDLFKVARDDIPDDLIQWVQRPPVIGTAPASPGFMQEIADPLGMRNAIVNRLWLGFERLRNTGWNAESKMTWQLLRQRDEESLDRNGDLLGQTTRRFGLVAKVERPVEIGRIDLRPRLKQELYMDDTPYLIERFLGAPRAERHDWSGLLSLMARIPFMKRSRIEIGLERFIFRDFVTDEDPVENPASGPGDGDPTGDFDETSFGVQLSNISPYAGYGLMLQMGLRVDRRKIEQFGDRSGIDTNALTFISIQAGLGSRY